MLSDQYELAILRALRAAPGGWCNSVEAAKATDLPAWTARSTLQNLWRRRMVDRGAGSGRWGHYSINERGMTELAAAEQLRLA